MNSYILSVVIPSLNAPDELLSLLHQIKECPEFEIILINQSKRVISTEIQLSNFREIILELPVPASTARNIGAKYSKSDYILFLDDDAIFFENSHMLMKNIFIDDSIDYFIFNRGYTTDNKYISSNPAISIINSNHWSVIRFITEWNICIKKSVFDSIGGFPDIGPGSIHLAKCGEAFILGSKLLQLSKCFMYHESIKISHPPLWGKKPYLTCLGYYYGAGYSVGFGLKNYPLHYKILWTLRTIIAAFRDFISPINSILSPIEVNINLIRFKLLVGIYRLIGLYDAFINAGPRVNK